MKDVMLDFETLSTENNASVIQIGAVYFDALTGSLGDTFKCNIKWDTLTGHLKPETILWWFNQSVEARDSITDQSNALTEEQAFIELNNFLTPAKHIWSHATFDFVILTNTLKRLNIKPNFSYRSAKDIRTLTYLADIRSISKREGTHHDALDDAIYQVKYCFECMKSLRKG